MEMMKAQGITLFFDAEERSVAELVCRACERSVEVIYQHWGLDVPPDCRVYVMTSWLRFAFHSAPLGRKVLLLVLFPLWSFRARKMWTIAGGWTQRHGKRVAVGVKPPRLIEEARGSIGERIFVKESDIEEKMQHVVCHELTHAFTSHLKLPMWLNEGLAQVAVDRYAGRPMVQERTLAALEAAPEGIEPMQYRQVCVDDEDSLVYHYVRGYWITRYIEDVAPNLLRRVLRRRYAPEVLEVEIAKALSMTRAVFWSRIDGEVVAHFGRKMA
jgi:hypothetical protein